MCRASICFAVTLCLFVLVGCGGGVDAPTYNKVTVGMSLQEVEVLLGTGQPLAVEDIELAGEGGRVSIKPLKGRSWMSGSAVVVILFQDDKVVGKLSKGLGVVMK